LWIPRFFDRRSWEEWEAKGKPGPRHAAREKARHLLRTHEPPPLEESVKKEIQKIIDAYENE
jgi:trimethylamine:corrinoid methyltransferase-like protein